MADFGGAAFDELDDGVPRFGRTERASYLRPGTRTVKQTMGGKDDTMSLPCSVDTLADYTALLAKVGTIATLTWAGGTRRCNLDAITSVTEAWDTGTLVMTLELTGL